MPAIQPPTPLKTFLICYGAENAFWLCEAEDRDHTVEQFEAAEADGDINEAFEFIPAMNRYFVRQRRAIWVCFVQKVEAEDEDAAVDALYQKFNPQHSSQRAPFNMLITVLDRREYPNANEVAEAD